MIIKPITGSDASLLTIQPPPRCAFACPAPMLGVRARHITGVGGLSTDFTKLRSPGGSPQLLTVEFSLA
jgi:hypothetical protein